MIFFCHSWPGLKEISDWWDLATLHSEKPRILLSSLILAKADSLFNEGYLFNKGMHHLEKHL
jgi:hypothetical protein